MRGLSFLVVGLLRLAGRSCGARAVVSGRFWCCGLSGAPAVRGLSFLVVGLRCCGLLGAPAVRELSFLVVGLLRLAVHEAITCSSSSGDGSSYTNIIALATLSIH